MARNEEKAQSMLNRYLQMKNKESQDTSIKRFAKRPALASQENNLANAERWRRQIIGEITAKVSEIQNETLGESRIRDLNDEINKLYRQKGHWERRIRELGGASYHSSLRLAKDEGVAVEGIPDYRYYGAAKKLKGVRELLKPEEEQKVKVSREDLISMIDVDYYGYRDDDDGLLEKLESKEETKARQKAIKEWEERNA